jgi:U5 small nuclear ribonucleoprotein component
MAANGVWGLGSDSRLGPNILIEDCIPPKPTFSPMVKSVIQRSFAWACRVGPLCDEMMRGVIFRIVDAQIDPNRPIIPAKLIPGFRKAVFAAFLAARPRVSEPIYAVEIISPHQGLAICREVLDKRRGQVLRVNPIVGTPLHMMKATVPLIDSFRMDVEIRRRTSGLAFPLSYFKEWALVPGDPLRSEIRLKPLEPSPDFALAREFVVKTRRRKGLGDEVDLAAHIDRELLIEIASLIGDE